MWYSGLKMAFAEASGIVLRPSRKETYFMSSEQQKQPWTTPTLIIYGDVEELTADIKNKTFGFGDDVLVQNQPTLHSSTP